jgi:hypothetical protein
LEGWRPEKLTADFRGFGGFSRIGGGVMSAYQTLM